MFNCEICQKTVGPSVKPIVVVAQTRAQTYHNEYYVEDELGNRELRKVDSLGTEIVEELRLCAEDAEQYYQVPAAPPKKASKPLIKFEEKQADSAEIKLVAVVVHNTLNTLTRNDVKLYPWREGKKDNGRAKRDLAVAIPQIKRFVDNNPTLVF